MLDLPNFNANERDVTRGKRPDWGLFILLVAQKDKEKNLGSSKIVQILLPKRCLRQEVSLEWH